MKAAVRCSYCEKPREDSVNGIPMCKKCESAWWKNRKKFNKYGSGFYEGKVE